jgi:tetratricopeptide (TPR) repeat protein
MTRRLRTWLASQDRINRVAITLVAIGLISFVGYKFWVEVTIARRANEAKTALSNRDYATARALLDECLTARPTSGEFNYLAARAARLSRDYQAANDYLTRAANLNWPENAIEFERALLRAQRGYFRVVEPALLAFLQANPSSEEADLVLEVIVPIYLQDYDLRRALDLLNQWTELRPDHLQLRLWQYEAARWMRAKNQAAEAIREAHKIAPDDLDIRLKLGEQLLEINQAAEAKPHFDYLVSRDPNRRDYRFGLARCEWLLGNTEYSIELLDGLLALEPENSAYLAQRGYAELFAGRPQQALPWLKKAADRNPYEVDLLTNLALCLEQNDRPEEAKVVREKAAVVDNDLREMKALAGAIAEKPRDPELWYQAGVILSRNGQEEEARRWFATALRLKPDHDGAQKALAQSPNLPTFRP